MTGDEFERLKRATSDPRIRAEIENCARIARMMDEELAATYRAERILAEERAALLGSLSRGRAKAALSPEAVRALSLVSEHDRDFAAVLHVDIPEIGARAGDVFVGREQAGPTYRRLAYAGGALRWLTREDYEELYRLDLTEAELEPLGKRYYGHPLEFLQSRVRWGGRLKVWHSRLALIHPVRETVSTPITANSDDGALFELLAQVGGRMPDGGAR